MYKANSTVARTSQQGWANDPARETRHMSSEKRKRENHKKFKKRVCTTTGEVGWYGIVMVWCSGMDDSGVGE